MGRKVEEEIHSVTILAGVALFFILLCVAIILYRRIMCEMSWGDACTFNPRDQRIIRANREYRRSDVEAAPKRNTIVRFQIDGKVLTNEDE